MKLLIDNQYLDFMHELYSSVLQTGLNDMAVSGLGAVTRSSPLSSVATSDNEHLSDAAARRFAVMMLYKQMQKDRQTIASRIEQKLNDPRGYRSIADALPDLTAYRLAGTLPQAMAAAVSGR